MKVKITTYANVVYRIADKTLETAEGIYQGRIGNELELQFQKSDNGTVPYSVNITINNNDNYFAHNIDFWASSVEIEQDNGVKWFGKITFYAFDSDNNLNITATERTAPEFELQLPDEVRQVYTVDDNFHQSSVTMTIPLAIGGTVENPLLLPTILIDKTNGIYLICVGEIHQIVNVYRGSERMTTGYTAYTGTSTQANHKGFAYVQIASEYRKNDDDTYAEITVEIVGLKLGNSTISQCRNGARFLFWFLKTASTGINGWGCGISENDIDIDSFNTAITLVDNSNLKLDGVMWLRQSAQSWIDQICQAIHGSYSIGVDGKRKLIIDNAQAVSKKTFTVANMRINRSGKNSYANVVYNKGSLSYGYNPVTGLFMQSAQYENSLSVAKLGEQKFIGESYLINDADTALAILEYICKKSEIGAEAINFKTNDLSTDLFVGDIITINRPLINITGDYQITSIAINDYTADITASKFDTSVFTVTGTNENVDWTEEAPIVSSVVPATPTNLVLSTGMEQKTNGTIDIYIDGSFTIPDGAWLFAAIQYGETSNPTTWNNLTTSANGAFRIIPVKPNTIYTIRVRLVTATGHSNYITSTITTAGDSTAPSAPTVAVSAPSVPANIVQNLNLTVTVSLANPPEDMAGFNLYRGTTNVPGSSTLIGFLSAKNGKATFTDVTPTVGNYYYWAKSVDVWGNASSYSSVATHTQDTTAPAAPTVTATVKQTTVNLSINLSTPPDDMAGFYLYRNANNTSSTATLLAFISAKDGKATFTDLTPSIGNYYYWAKSADVWGNNSAFSSVASVTTQAVVADEVAATALSIPTGAILRLSAKGCATASIAQENGVIDVSGNGNNANVGSMKNIQVINDSEMGACFYNAQPSYSNRINLKTLAGLGFDANSEYTIHIKYKQISRTSGSVLLWSACSSWNQYNERAIWIRSTGTLDFYWGHDGTSSGAVFYKSYAIDLNKIYTFTIISKLDYVAFYVNGVLVGSKTGTYVNFNLNNAHHIMGFWTYQNTPEQTFVVSDFRIYPYALTDKQVKSLYMFPDEALFAQLTADLIGTNVINAKNLVKTEAVITETAQISQAIVKDLVVTNGVTIGDLNTTAQNANTTANSASNKINNLQVGGVNLYNKIVGVNSRCEIINNGKAVKILWAQYSQPSNIQDTYFFIRAYKTIANGKQYTISFTCTGLASDNDYCTFAFQNRENYKIRVKNGRCSYTFTSPATFAADTNILIDDQTSPRSLSAMTDFTLTDWQIEEGNVATTYSPAPEDTDALITTAQQTANTAVTNAATAQTTANTAQSTANTANTNASNALTNAATAQTTADTAITYATKLYGTCSTAASTAAKVVTLSGFKLFTGASISVKFTNANTVANPTLNVNSTGAKTIYANGSALTANKTWAAGDTVSFVYNGSQWEIDPTIIRLNGVMTTDYTNIQGGKIKTGIIASGSFDITTYRNNSTGAVDGTKTYDSTNQRYHGGTFATAGSAYDLDYGEIHTPYFYSNSTGAGIKGHIEAATGKIGEYEITQSGFLEAGLNSATTVGIKLGYYGDYSEISGRGMHVRDSDLANTDGVFETYYHPRFIESWITADTNNVHFKLDYKNGLSIVYSGDHSTTNDKSLTLDLNGLVLQSWEITPVGDLPIIKSSVTISTTGDITTSGNINLSKNIISSDGVTVSSSLTGNRGKLVIQSSASYPGLLLPSATSTGKIGTAAYRWNEAYINSVYGQLVHSSNVNWNSLNGAAVYSPTAITSGVDYLWGVKTRTANYWNGFGVLDNSFYFTFFNNNLLENAYYNALAIWAHDNNYISLRATGGYMRMLNHIYPNASDTYYLGAETLRWAGAWLKNLNGYDITNIGASGTNYGFKIGRLIINFGKTSSDTVSSATFMYPFGSTDSYFIVANPLTASTGANYAVSIQKFAKNAARLRSATAVEKIYLAVGWA